MGNLSRQMESLMKNQKEMPEIRTLIEMKNSFDKFIIRLDTAEEKVSELEDIFIETSKTKKQREKKNK